MSGACRSLCSPIGRPPPVHASWRTELHNPSEAVLQLAQRWPFRYLGLYWKGYTRTVAFGGVGLGGGQDGSRSRHIARGCMAFPV